MNKIAAAAVSAAVAVSGLAATATASASPTRPTAGSSTAAPSAAAPSAVRAHGYTPPPLTWHTCDDPTLADYGLQCADLVVPLDYARPSGRTITLAVSRHLHTSPDADYQGVMLVNPGGPGGSGLIFSAYGQGRFVPGDGDTEYDWIGFDPRGVGASRPALTCNPRVLGYDRPPYEPASRRILASWLRRSERYADACEKDAPGLLDHVRTTDSVQDMESLRKALGQQRINFYGFSYGTYLGQVYATLHPRRVRRFVLDGTVDPRRVWYEANLDQDRAFQRTTTIYFRWLARHHRLYHLGDTGRKVAAGFYAERRKLDRHAAGGVIGGDELSDVLLSAGYYVYDWVDIAKAYARLVNRGDHAGVKKRYDDANPQTPGSDNGNAMYLATSCTDDRWPRSLARVLRDNRRVERVAPFFTWGNAWLNGPCSFWDGRAGTPVRVSGTHLHRHILMVNETYDAATPYSGALEVRRIFSGARLIEGVGGTTHAGSLSGVPCTDDAIGRYLTDGTVPPRRSGDRSDKRCPPVPRPDPTAAAAKRSGVRPAAGDALPAALRRALEAAQRP